MQSEDLLQFIWQYALYRPDALTTTEGEQVTVVSPGIRNRDAGPDFSAARIRLNQTLFAGNVELHLKSSDWLRHGHQHDPAYDRLVLHVVYEHDTGPELPNHIPVLQLKDHIPDYVLAQYTSLLQTPAALPCQHRLHEIPEVIRESWLNRMLAERWEEKLGDWQLQLAQAGNDWRTLFYWRLAAAFGLNVNAQPFLMLAQSLALTLLAKHHHNLFQLEALLFGQAGMLTGDFTDDYPTRLQQEYRFLAQKYRLQSIPAALWKFMRMRPANFPTIRIAQLAALIHQSETLMAAMMQTGSYKALELQLSVKASAYWDGHFRFDTPTAVNSKKQLGEAAIQYLIINAIAPMQFLYHGEQGNLTAQEAALQLLESIPAEKNSRLTPWVEAGWQAGHAGHSQALIQLFTNYCSSKRCLECAVGLHLIRRSPVK